MYMGTSHSNGSVHMQNTCKISHGLNMKAVTSLGQKKKKGKVQQVFKAHSRFFNPSSLIFNPLLPQCPVKQLCRALLETVYLMT